jgi:dienelactone hydrolase
MDTLKKRRRLVLSLFVSGLMACGPGGRAGDDEADATDDGRIVDGPSPIDVDLPHGGGDAGATPDAGCDFPPVPAVTFTEGTSGPTTYFLRVEANPRGLVVALHGTNGSARSLAENKVEWWAFFREAGALGYSVLIPESEQRDMPRRWENSPDAGNPDLARIEALIGVARAEGALSAGQPIMFIGMSQGGGVAPIFGQVLASRGLPVRAVAVHSAGGGATSNDAYRLPTTFVAMANDTIVSAAESQASARLLTERGIDSTVFVLPETTVCPERFTRISGLDASASRQIFDGLVAAGALGADGAVLTAADDQVTDSSLAGVPAAYAPFTRAIDEQLQVAGARHTFFGGRARETLAFFEAHR